MTPDWLYLLLPLFLIAVLYGMVGHGGASGYLAIMALAGIAPLVMKPTALTLNLAVSLIGTVLFLKAGHFAWRLFWPFAAISMPFAFLGGRIDVSTSLFKLLLALALGFAALRLLLPAPKSDELRPVSLGWVLFAGALMGLASGLIGVGGGIFLTPLLLLMRWAGTKTAAAVSAPFIFVNSAAGLAGHSASLHHLPAVWPWLALAVVIGGFIGARWGSLHARSTQLRPALALVLGVACVKLVITT
ncbi:MAG: hypothetical protein K0R17_3776 [Rariglobus sp.]|jgi:uncharacterized membrane protein YfcA|nr:hypothetical protein [Rariglobus sp.]